MRALAVYISGPLTEGGTADPPTRQAHVNAAVAAFKTLLAAGAAPLCPHLSHYAETRHGCDFPHDVWIAADLAWVARSDIVLRLQGSSSGADAECQHARSLNIPVSYSIEEILAFGREVHLEPFPLDEELADK